VELHEDIIILIGDALMAATIGDLVIIDAHTIDDQFIVEGMFIVAVIIHVDEATVDIIGGLTEDIGVHTAEDVVGWCVGRNVRII
jgi:hypothetical protein